MNEASDIDKLFDEADAEQKRRQELEERIKKPIVRSYQEFLDKDGKVKDQSPFYVVMHKNAIEADLEIDEQTRIKLLEQIKFIEENFDHTSAGPFERASGVPSDRPIIVCGAYDAICVGQQHDLLIKGGFDAYISKEGTLPFNKNKPLRNQAG
ncbi:MAG: hypothetical protein M1308_21815 [Actinobacteria bacterium]|nr:hypothetical protein [Actinomycetota bacterium]